MIRLASIHVYPVKSCRGIAYAQADLDALGIAGDRRWMVVDGGGRFVTQREEPALATIATALGPGELVLSAPGAAPLRVPTVDDAAARPMRAIEVWRHRGPAIDEGDAAADWVSAFLRRPCRLVRTPPGHRRRVSPERFPGEAHTAFTDGYPLLVLSQASLDDLNGRLPAPLPTDRFRPNLVVAGAEPYAEDRWRRIRVGDVELELVKSCPRCTITTVDQATGERRPPEPLRSLAAYRREGDDVVLGRYAVHRSKGRLAVGAAVAPIATP